MGQNLNIAWQVNIKFIMRKLHLDPEVRGFIVQHRAASLFLQITKCAL
jgi:hypothetical protein